MDASARRIDRVDKIRRARACNTCRSKKVKCDGKRPICSSCTAFKLSCTFQDVSLRLHHADRRSSPSYTEELERRLEDMEQRLQSLDKTESKTGLNTQDSAHPASHSPVVLADSNYYDARETQTNSPQDTTIRDSRNILTSQDGTVRFFGASSGFGIRSLSETNDTGLGAETSIRGQASSYASIPSRMKSWIPRVLSDPFPQPAAQPLPPKHETDILVRSFLSTFNQVIPLVEETSFLRLVEKQFSWNADDSPSWWVLFNVVLAFSYADRAQGNPDGSDDWTKSLGHIKNALNSVMSLFLQISDLRAVQGLLGLALYFQGTPNPQALFMFAAMAMRLSHSIGLHRNITSGLSHIEIETRRRTFWIAFMLDADISIRVGRPPLQDEEDYDTPLPSEAPFDSRGVIEVDGVSVNLFLKLVQFARVQRRTYRHLYTFAALRKPSDTMIQSAHECEKILLEWKKDLPNLPKFENVQYLHTEHWLRQILRLHLAYCSCHANLRQLPLSAAMKNSTNNDLDIHETMSEISLRALNSARAAVELIPYIQRFGSEYQWNVLYFLASASIALLSEICVNPGNHGTTGDLSLASGVIKYLRESSSDEPGTYVEYIVNVCSDMKSSARRALDEWQKGRGTDPTENWRDGYIADRQKWPQQINQPSSAGLTSNASAPGRDLIDFSMETNLLGVPYQDIDAMMNSQISFPLFWNWQDAPLDISSTLNPNGHHQNQGNFDSQQ